MTTLQIDIINPKAARLLQDLADMDLIAIKRETEDNFLKVINRLRTKAASNPPGLEEITKEVELIRTKRYAKKKR